MNHETDYYGMCYIITKNDVVFINKEEIPLFWSEERPFPDEKDIRCYIKNNPFPKEENYTEENFLKDYLEEGNNRLRGTTSKKIAEYVISVCLRAVDEYDEYDEIVTID